MVKLYNLSVPSQAVIPVVASLPHSGTHVPRGIRSQFSDYPGLVLAPVDWHLEKLYDFLPELGINMLQATHSRYVVNLNRGTDTPLFGPEATSVVPEKTCFGRQLYDREPVKDEVEARIDRYYTPYHQRLTRLLRNTVEDFGQVYLLDLHSYYMGPEVDVCLGNVDNTTCSEPLIGEFEKAFNSHGFTVTRNDKWTGGYITRHYGNMDNIETLQIEIRFPSYLEGGTFGEEEVPGWESAKFRKAKSRLRKVFSDVISGLQKENAL
jgi:N-formylglutamate deformylase